MLVLISGTPGVNFLRPLFASPLNWRMMVVMFSNLPNDSAQTNARDFGGPIPVTAILAVVLSLGYFGLYSATLHGKIVYTNYLEPSDAIDPNYKYFGAAAKHIFLPANWIDRHIRKEYWSTVKKGDGTEWHVPYDL